ncbi:Dps family protein [Blastopirellula marina]|uniref:Stress-and starvation-induced gene controlled by sigma-B n=1 Tax=Blastopirellula marina DSM 3645 TaxID=314230 RepID=A3ZML2_9BACT|nr:DNA starvation/stationary phase protection protein [Blastopirellula marina]EAQ82185.1 stress- and starvation-induced gene controlled by sigma-B [Blastopirellula marina DSM 3645]
MSDHGAAKEIGTLLADYAVFYQKLRGYHWNVVGKDFFPLHAKFEELYNDAAEGIDALAERIRALGANPPATFSEFLKLTTMTEDSSQPSAEAMVANLHADMGKLNDHVKKVHAHAEEIGDTGSVIILEDFIVSLEKERWMLNSYLQA